jgi:hypothetical protein
VIRRRPQEPSSAEPSPADVGAAVELLGMNDNPSELVIMYRRAWGFLTDPAAAKARILDAVQEIREHNPRSPHQVRDGLRAVNDSVRRTLSAIRNLEEDVDRERLRSLAAELERVERENETRIAELGGDAMRRSGGAKLAAEKINLAAGLAFNLLQDCCVVPTLTEGGPYHRLTALLYKMATGRQREPGRACKEVTEELNWRGGDELRAQRREWHEQETLLRNARFVEKEELEAAAADRFEKALGQMSDDDLAQLGLSRRS